MSDITVKRKESIQIGNDPSIRNDSISSIVTLRENGLSECSIVANDEDGAMYLSTLHLYDIVTVKYAYEEDSGNLDSDSDWTDIDPVFRGWIIDLSPNLAVSGETVSVTAMNGLGLKMMRVAREYGIGIRYNEVNNIVMDRYVDTWSNEADNWTHIGDYPWLDASETSYTKILSDNSSIGLVDAAYKFVAIPDTQSIKIASALTLNLRCRLVSGEGGYATSVTVYILIDNGYEVVALPLVVVDNHDDFATYTVDAISVGIDVTTLQDWKIYLSIVAVDGGGSDKGYLHIGAAYMNVTFSEWDQMSPTIRNILANTNLGIIPRYVEKILDTNDSSQYTIGTDYIANDTSEYDYINFPYQDAFMCLQDLIRLGTAMNYLDNPSNWRGLHWMIDIDSNLLVAPVGDHNVSGIDDNYTIEDLWTTRPLGNTPLVVRQDMIRQSFKTEVPVANHILVAGKFIFPQDELWTETDISGWKGYYKTGGSPPWIEDDRITISLDSTTYIVGHKSLDLALGVAGGYGMFIHPLNVNFSTISTKDILAKLLFYFMMGGYVGALEIRFFEASNATTPNWDKWFSHSISPIQDIWTKFDLDITNLATNNSEWINNGNANWDNIRFIAIHFADSGTGTSHCHLDSLEIVGNVIRGVYTGDCGQSSKENCTIGCIKHYGCRFLTIKDSIANTDTLDANDTNSSLTKLAIYELLRNRVIRTSGVIEIPINPILKAGQIVHVHSRPYSNGTYAIDKDFRITECKHEFSRRIASTTLQLLDDLYNAIPINTFDPYSTVMRVINPDFQTRVLGSLKISGGDFNSKMIPISKAYNQ